MNNRNEEIRRYFDSPEFNGMIPSSDPDNYYKAYWHLLRRFGYDGVLFLERFHASHDIQGARRNMSKTVADEWRDKRDFGRQTKAERRANISIVIAVCAILVTLIFQILD